MWLWTGSHDFYDFFDLHVVALAGMLDDTLAEPANVFKVWLAEQELFDLDDDDRELLMTLISERGTWEVVVVRKMGGQ